MCLWDIGKEYNPFYTRNVDVCSRKWHVQEVMQGVLEAPIEKEGMD